MFWKLIRWGGTALVIGVLLFAVLTNKPATSETGDTPAAQQDSTDSSPVIQPSKNFNL